MEMYVVVLKKNKEPHKLDINALSL